MAAILVSRWYEFIIFGSMVWVSWWFLCLDLSFWLGLDLIVASVGYVVEDQLGLCV